MRSPREVTCIGQPATEPQKHSNLSLTPRFGWLLLFRNADSKTVINESARNTE